jgi:uncharacterized protein (UPF0297 family)
VHDVVGYLLCGKIANTADAREKVLGLERQQIYVRTYEDLLGMVEKSHKEFLTKYKKLKDAKSAAGGN